MYVKINSCQPPSQPQTKNASKATKGTFTNLKFLQLLHKFHMPFINRPGVSWAVIQTPLSLINSFIHSFIRLCHLRDMYLHGS